MLKVSWLVGLLLLVYANHTHATSCSDSNYDSFDFWLGTWQVHTKDGKLVGHNTISKAYNNCVVKEQYTAAASGYRGESLNIYNQGAKQWTQSWVDNTGLLLWLSGDWNGKSMVLRGKQKSGKGTNMHRISWTPVSKTEVHQHWETSSDSGKTWKTSFYGIYTPKPQN